MPSGEAPERGKVKTGPAVEKKTGPPQRVAASERWNPHHGVTVPAKGKHLCRTFVGHKAGLRPHRAGLTEHSVGQGVGVVHKHKPFARPDGFHHPKAWPDLIASNHACGIERFPAARFHRESPPSLRIVVSRNQDHIERGVQGSRALRLASASWLRSPRITSCLAAVSARNLSRRSKLSEVEPSGTGTPLARKLAALPRCTSATTSCPCCGRKSAHPGRRIMPSSATAPVNCGFTGGLHSHERRVQVPRPCAPGAG